MAVAHFQTAATCLFAYYPPPILASSLCPGVHCTHKLLLLYHLEVCMCALFVKDNYYLPCLCLAVSVQSICAASAASLSLFFLSNSYLCAFAPSLSLLFYLLFIFFPLLTLSLIYSIYRRMAVILRPEKKRPKLECDANKTSKSNISDTAILRAVISTAISARQLHFVQLT